MTSPPRSHRDRPCRIRPRWRMPARWSRGMVSTVDDAVGARWTIPANESCKPGDAAFARAHFELIARPKASLDAAIRLRAETPATRSSISAPISRARRATSPPTMPRLALQARAEGKRVAILSGGELTVTVRGKGRGGPNQEYALALADLLEGDAGHCRRWPATPTAPMAAPAARPIRPARSSIRHTFAKMKSLGLDRQSLSRQQRRHGVLRRRPAICC